MIQLKSLINEFRTGRSLRVFDFDDTLAKTQSNIKVVHIDGTEDDLSPAEYAQYEPKEGDKFDFKDFQRMLKNPRVIKNNIDVLEKALKNPRNKVTILTARQLSFPIRHFLKKTFGLDVYVVALGDSDPKKKADWIERKIKSGYNDIFFMDDSIKNIEAVEKLKYKYPNIKIELRLA